MEEEELRRQLPHLVSVVDATSLEAIGDRTWRQGGWRGVLSAARIVALVV